MIIKNKNDVTIIINDEIGVGASSHCLLYSDIGHGGNVNYAFFLFYGGTVV